MRKQTVIMYQLDLKTLLCEFGGKLTMHTARLQAGQYGIWQQAEAVLEAHVPVLASWDAHRH